MQQNFTSNDLVRFLYKETNASETIQISRALNEDNELAQEMEALSAAYSQLPKVTFSPSSKSIQNILGYSKQTSLAH